MKNSNFFVVQGWMVNDLKLSGNELMVYAIIYGFSQDGEHWFTGTSKYLSECIGTQKQAPLLILKKLTEKGFIDKKEVEINGVKFCHYRAIYNSTPHTEINHPPHTEINHPPHTEIVDNNIDIYNINNNNIIPPIIPQGGKDKKIHKGDENELREIINANLPVEVIPIYLEYISMRNEIRKPIKSKTSLLKNIDLLKKLALSGKCNMNTILENSIANQYQGLFPYKEHHIQNNNNNPWTNYNENYEHDDF